MEKKKTRILLGMAITLVLIGILIWLVVNNKQTKPEEVLKDYMEKIGQADYEGMYELLDQASKDKISKEDFISRNKNIYEGIEVDSVNIQINEVHKTDNQTVEISYSTNLETMAGEISFSNQATFSKDKDKQYKLEWRSNLIFPDLYDDNKVKVSTLPAQRGNILDRNGVALAKQGVASSVGLVPGKMQEDATADITQIAELLEISEESIQKSLSASYVKEDTFVPIKTVGKEEQELKQQLLAIKGVKITDTKVRIYPIGESASHLIGYVQNINAEELEQNKEKGYNKNSVIGKSGIERIYEDTLRGIDGCEIYLTDEKGEKKETLAKQDIKNGEDVKLTIDSKLQTKIYEQLKEDKSACVAMNHQTGEILALVSTPTFDSNDFSMGISPIKWETLQQDEKNPMYNRYLSTWAPGSSFKPIIGAIGLSENCFTAEENFGRSGLSWQKDSSWGNYKITTLQEYGDMVNLRNALIYSDNIYFAKAALKIGADTLQKRLNAIGFGKEMTFEQTLKNSQLSSKGAFETEVQLADSGYGQGQVLVNPVHIASIYSAFSNEGNMVKPYLIYQENPERQYLVEGAFSKEAAETIKEDLIQVVEDNHGTAHEAKIHGVTLAGKTGTAEIKTSKEDTTGTELGWFNAFTVGDSRNLLIISMIEDVKGRGGSHYLLPKVKNMLE